MVRAVPMNIADQPPEKKRSALFLPEEEWVKALSGRLICIRTFGCAYNVGDSDLLATVLTASGSVIVSDPDLAEVMIINTCIVIASTERKMQKEISSYPDHEVYVTGCLPLALPENIQNYTTVKLIHPDSIHRAAATVPHDQKGPVSWSRLDLVVSDHAGIVSPAAPGDQSGVIPSTDSFTYCQLCLGGSR
jgi:hypothetical protein